MTSSQPLDNQPSTGDSNGKFCGSVYYPTLGLLSFRQAAMELGVSTRTIHRYVRLNWIPVVRITRRTYRIRRTDLDNFIQRSSQGGQSTSGTSQDSSETKAVVYSETQMELSF
jgi:excisionase family DNA binding protein